MIAVLAQPRHHDAPLDGGDDVLRKDSRRDLHLQISCFAGFTQDVGQEIRPIPEDFPYQVYETIIRVAQFQSGIAEQSAADELCTPVLFEDCIEKVG